MMVFANDTHTKKQSDRWQLSSNPVETLNVRTTPNGKYLRWI